MNDNLPDDIRQHISPPSLIRRLESNSSVVEQQQQHTIHVLQWNILAQALSYPDENFVRVKSEMVAYETRKWRILEQILSNSPDLCSLQEMDVYDCFLKEHLPKYGYTCFFVAKPNSRCLSFRHHVEDFKGPDGILLCYKSNIFKEIDRTDVTLPDDGRHGKQIFTLLELEHRPTSIRLIFIGTHFKAKKQFAESRLNQANALIHYLSERYPTRPHIIAAGDFNGEIDEPFYEKIYRSGLRSAYRTLLNGREPPYTTWKFKARDESREKEESRTIDYIFYKPEGFIPISYLTLPTKNDIGPNALPSVNYPSDHIALEVVFAIRS